MKRFCWFGVAAVLAVVVAAVVSGIGARSAAAADDEETLRDIVRMYRSPDKESAAGKVLAKKIGFSKEVEHVVALEYSILLRADGKETPVADLKAYQFKLGDQIRVKIEPVKDSYLYILHEGPSGNRTCLLPTKEEKPPFVKGGGSVILPDEGFFEFTAPPGDEQLLVVATEKPVSDLGALANVVFNKPDDQLTPEEKEIKKTISAKVRERLKSIQQRQAETTTYRGLLTEESMRDFAKKVEQSGASEAVVEEPANKTNGSTFVMMASTKADARPTLLVMIPLRSIALKIKRP